MARGAAERTGDDAPPVDPLAIPRAYRRERARRRARVERQREQRIARLRFLIAMLVLLTASALLTLTVWEQVRRVFGL